MGKGGTRFVGDAIASRAKAKGYTSKDMQKDMEKYLETGVHPEVERARLAQQEVIPPLPERSTQRPHVFLDVEGNKKTQGRLVVELFDDVAPVAVTHFRNRCSEGASDSFKGTAIHRLVKDMAAVGGRSRSYREGVHMKKYTQLRHSEEGLVSISLQGDEFAITLGRALGMDDTHQVVGRLCGGLQLLGLLNSMKSDVNDAPQHRLRIARCGFTDAAGTLEDFDEAGASAGGNKKETAEEGAAQVRLEAAKARESVRQALQTGLEASGSKRKQPEGGGGGGGGGVSAKRGMLDSMLGDLSSSEEEEEEEEA
ncbi:peptidyl-prolyl cis-trans isomerase H isoform A [Micractinium conductrix]|uniref:Peptidyl-prolyl cis-trans isomerase H isoform A n=1 Tax=Micractinium conductrix TaxID=554055 RepID=A0A2P6V7Q0_9CHLO|nr:peptidyl-prolyl cis-trans isomerase H isoform B [Micractinium conductrix]PSC70114.1 peptidyl-prolyl cis-trans isomerase H isoform A [Micractinium conductrix]|eukprot:PSC70113.1 peptidyl-prolyl cis-trans isomerase H isoform B [Micractinium conductrix]